VGKSKKSKIAGQINFIQNHIPPFDAGTYRLVLSQALSVAGEPLKHSYQFAVAGERFRFNPSEIGTVYPPADSTGEYDNVLPHVVLTRKTLPWERTATGGAPKQGANSDVAPWIGLLVFDATDAPTLQTVKVGDLFDQEDHDDSQLPSNAFSPFSRRPPHLDKPRTPADELGYHEKVDDVCQVIDIPLTTFNKVAPAQEDLHWLAHARRLSVPLPQKTPSDAEPQMVSSDFAAVFGNRLPAVGEGNTAFLVSLEAVANYLPNAAGKAAADTLIQAQRKTDIRLVVLHRWSFTVKPAKEKNHQSFAQLIANLNGSDPGKSLLRWPQRTANADVDRAFALGYTVLPHQTRLGDQTVSWYRGPFVPHSAEKTVTLPIMSADAVTFYDKQIGMFDVAYAAAWQLGRLLALNNKGFATQLYTWKRAVRQRTHDSMVQKHLRAMAPQHANPEEETHKRSLVQTIVTSSLRNALDHKQFDGVHPPPRRDRHAQKMHAVTDPDKLEQVHNDKPPVPPSLAKWLGRLMLLHGVPFNYLVPDQRLLPLESLRFFQLDANWMASLIDGANAIGRIGHADAHDQVFADYLFQLACAAAGMQSLDMVSGFLLCSALVDGWWPGLKIDGYKAAEYELIRLPQDEGNLPDEKKNLVIVKKTDDLYCARIFDRAGKKVKDTDDVKFMPDEALVRQLDTAFNSPSIDIQTRRELIRKITSSLDYTQVAEDHPDDALRLPMLRLEQLAPNVLLCLFDGIVSRLDFHPPPEGLHFGLTVLDRDDNDVPIEFEKELRSMETGKEIIDHCDKAVERALAVKAIPFRGERVLQVANLASSLKRKLGNPATFTSAELAMQMIEGTQMGGFIHNVEGEQ